MRYLIFPGVVEETCPQYRSHREQYRVPSSPRQGTLIPHPEGSSIPAIPSIKGGRDKAGLPPSLAGTPISLPEW